MTPERINIITDILGALLVIFEPVKAYLMNQTFSWDTFAVCIGSAIIAWYTGKSTLAAKK